MSDVNIGRVQRDLDSIRQAMEPQPTVSKEHVWHNLIIAAVGVVLGCVTAWSGIATLVDGGPNLRYVALVLSAASAVLVSVVLIGVKRKDDSPSFFKYTWKSTLAATAASVVYLAFLVWAFRTGLSLGTLAIATVFFSGVFQLVSTFWESWNPVGTGGGMARVLVGLGARTTS